MCCSWRGKLTIRSREVVSLILLCVGGKSSLIIAWVWQGKILVLAESLFSSCSAKTALHTLFIGGSWIYPVMELKMSSFIYSPWLVSCFVPAILMQSLVGVIIGQIILLYPHSGLNAMSGGSESFRKLYVSSLHYSHNCSIDKPSL